MATNYSINYDDKRFASVEADKKVALSEVEKTYGGMINEADKYYQAQINAAKEYGETQAKNQQAQTDFAIEQIEQQKEQAKKDYTKEQQGAYVDWQKQSNQYGANAEAMAAQGMANTGYSESSQVSMYNTYQNRIATAREVYSRAVLNYDNAIKDARLQNNAALAEIAYNALQAQLELSLEGFQYKNSLIMAKSDKKMDVDNNYYNRYQDVLSQINTENALAEEVRQYDKSYALKEKEYEEGVRQFNEQLQIEKDKLTEEKRQFDKKYSGVNYAAQNVAGVKYKGGSTKKKYSGVNYAKQNTTGIKKNGNSSTKMPTDAKDYLNKLIASGASKDKVSNEIALALREGAITKTEATNLRRVFTRPGIQY